MKKNRRYITPFDKNGICTEIRDKKYSLFNKRKQYIAEGLEYIIRSPKDDRYILLEKDDYCSKDNPAMVINSQGDIIFEFTQELDRVSGYCCGRLGFCKNDKWGFLDLKGKVVVTPRYDSIGSFSEDRCRVTVVKSVKIKGKRRKKKMTKHGYIDLLGNWIMQPILDNGLVFQDGNTVVEYEGNKYHIDLKGKRI